MPRWPGDAGAPIARDISSLFLGTRVPLIPEGDPRQGPPNEQRTANTGPAKPMSHSRLTTGRIAPDGGIRPGAFAAGRGRFLLAGEPRALHNGHHDSTKLLLRRLHSCSLPRGRAKDHGVGRRMASDLRVRPVRRALYARPGRVGRTRTVRRSKPSHVGLDGTAPLCDNYHKRNIDAAYGQDHD